MKKLISIFLVFISLLYSCVDNFKDENEEPDSSDTTPSIPMEGKKGAALVTRGDWSNMVSNLKVHWHYSWGNSLSEFLPDNVEFVPMVWGKNWINAERVEELKSLKNDGKIKYLLGFNEPDGVEQANMTVAEALEIWPLLEKVDVPLGSPATKNPLNDWMKEFMQQAEQRDLKVDFVCIHWYGGTNAQGLIDRLEETYKLYGKPIWITEFAPADWNAATPDENRHSPDAVLSFMQNVLPQLENLSYVHRYSWFSFDQNRAEGSSSALFDNDGNLTILGDFYANFEPNNEIGPGKKPIAPEQDPDNLILNGGFETGEIYPWGGYKNGVVEDSNRAYEGLFFGRIEGGDGSLLYFLDVEPGATYQLEFYAKWGTETNQSFNFAVREETGDQVRFFQQEIIADADDWTYNKAEFKATNESKIRLIWFKGQGFPAFFLDNVICKKIE
jgi:hypothetical protein